MMPILLPILHVTPEMIARGIAFLEDSPLHALTTLISHPPFVEEFLRAAIGDTFSRSGRVELPATASWSWRPKTGLARVESPVAWEGA
jgi:hypothetical protein